MTKQLMHTILLYTKSGPISGPISNQG